jgi:hypothetical protein
LLRVLPYAGTSGAKGVRCGPVWVLAWQAAHRRSFVYYDLRVLASWNMLPCVEYRFMCCDYPMLNLHPISHSTRSSCIEMLNVGQVMLDLGQVSYTQRMLSDAQIQPLRTSMSHIYLVTSPWYWDKSRTELHSMVRGCSPELWHHPSRST